MPLKKKSTQKNARSTMNKPSAFKPSKAIKSPEPIRAASKNTDGTRATATGGRTGAVAVPATISEGPRQLANFDAAMKLFHARKLKDAREMFVKAAEGPERDVANRARLHITMCDRRLQQETVHLRSADDYYNYGIALLNARNVSEARKHLDKALEMAPESDHIHYALALAQAMSGDLTNAHANLKRAIELEPRNRLIARQDADFAHIANQSPFIELIYPEKKGW
jgi:tetratricopeptide (TPR) repeat protein